MMALAAGCASGGHGKTELAAVPPPKAGGPLQTAGPRCQGARCTCREIDDYGRPTGDSSRNEGDVAPGMKRFEFRTGRGAWAGGFFSGRVAGPTNCGSR